MACRYFTGREIMQKKHFLSIALSALLIWSASFGACGAPTDANSSFEESQSTPAPLESSSMESSSSINEEEKTEWISSDWSIVPENKNKNFQYFGYYHTDGFLTQGSYLDEIAALDHANVAPVGAWSVDEAREKLEKIKQYGMKALLGIGGLYRVGTVGKLNSGMLNEKYRAKFLEYKEGLKSYIDDGTIYAFYFDEPRWWGISADDFRTLTKFMREQVPTVGVMACMTAMDIGASNYGNVGECEDNYLEFCSDVMFDAYAAWDDETRLDWLEMLKSKATQNQWIWGCVKGFVSEITDAQIEIMKAHVKGQYTEAIQDERYRGMLSFSYADGEEVNWKYGMNNFLNKDKDYFNADLYTLYTDITAQIIK